MSRHDDRISLRQMLDYARRACDMARGRQRSDLDTDEMLQLALTRLVEITGEAASRVSKSTQQNHTDVPWTDIINMRHRL